MVSDYDIFEIVHVIRDFWLFDTKLYQRKYCTQHGQPLAPGFYVVNWPELIRVRRFNLHAVYHGPFKLRQEALAALNCMRQERENFLKMVNEKALAETLISSGMAGKKVSLHELKSTKAA
jgi:hypothetical protein